MSIRLLLCALLLPFCAAPVAASSDGAARRVLLASLDAVRVPYEGQVSVTSRKGTRERVRALLVSFAPPARYRRELVDRLGLTVLTVVSDGETEWVYDRPRGIAWRGEPADPDYKLLDPDEEYALLARNYDLRLSGTARIAGRECDRLEVLSRRTRRPVRRLCVDKRHGIVLRRETFSPDGTLASEVRFVRIRVPAPVPEREFVFSPPSGVEVVPSRLEPDFLELEEAALATDMTPRLPAWIPPGYVFESVNLLAYKGMTMLHCRYSDGIDVLSLYQAPARARLDFRGPGAAAPVWTVRLRQGAGRVALWSGGKILEWGAGDRFVLIGRLGVDALKRVADSMPEVSLKGGSWRDDPAGLPPVEPLVPSGEGR